ncbi:MAG TPA: zinc ribbon domain-containing protein [Dehalococcoidia bacterium]|nr:zinc ribbon domain-containing protein [Dehalococcoidia bacterium]
MPIYEFSCNSCQNRVSIFVRSMNSPVSGKCDRCGSEDLRRLVSRVAVIKSGGDFDSLGDDRLLSGFDENDPKAMAAWARRMQREMGEDAGPEFEEMIEKLERGESLDEGFGESDDFDDDDDGFDDL